MAWRCSAESVHVFYAIKPMKKLLLTVPLLLILCCCNNGGKEAVETPALRGEMAVGDTAALPDSVRIESLSREMEELMDEYDADDNPETFKRALALNDSLERIDTTRQGHFYVTLTRSQLLARAGKMKEAMRLQESILDKDPNNFVRLQFFAGKYLLEGKRDSSRIFAERALVVCDKIMKDSAGSQPAVDQALANKLSIYYILNDRIKAKEVSDMLAKRHKNDPNYQLTDEQFNTEFDQAREELNRSASAWRNDE